MTEEEQTDHDNGLIPPEVQVYFIKCPQCKQITSGDYCGYCGASLNTIEKAYPIIPDYPFGTHGPKQTQWPPPSKNSWYFTELSRNSNPEQENTISWTPALSLGSGEYDIVLSTNSEESHNNKYPIYISNIIEPLGVLVAVPQHTGINSDNSIRLTLFEPISVIQLGVQLGSQDVPVDVGLLLVPRLGQIWYGSELPHVRIEVNNTEIDYGYSSTAQGWQIDASKFRDEFLTFGPYSSLTYGDYVATFRLSCGNWVSEESPILAIDIFSSFEGTSPKIGSESLEKREICSKDILKPNKPQDFTINFHLDPFVYEDRVPGVHRRVECRVRTLSPADVSVHHIRLSTADDLINEKYYELGGIDSPLGPPLGHTFTAAKSKEGTSGFLKRYLAGSIYWSPQFGAHETYGCVGYLFEKYGGTVGNPPNLGFPRSGVRKLVSSYLTEAYVQYFQGVLNKGSAAIYAQTLTGDCLDHTYEVYGHIGYIYFQELGGHEGPLGLPMSGEHWASEEKKIRRNYFEGGLIEAIEVESGKWEKHRVIFYPRPKLKTPRTPEIVYCGDPCTVRIEIDNHGGDAHEGYLTLSFPDSSVEKISVDSDFGKHIISKQDDEIHTKYGSGQKIKAVYPRAELVIVPFKAGENYWMDVTFTPTQVGSLRFYLRCTAGKIPKYEKLNIHFEGDPSPVGLEPVDQQEEHVYEYSIDVLEKPYADLRIIDIVAQPLVRKSWGFITLVLQNVGTGIAKDIAIILDDLLRSRGNLRIKSIDPGEQHPIILNISPNDPGIVDLQFSLTYLDQFDQSHKYDLTRRHIIHENADHIFRYESINVGIPEGLFTSIANTFAECDEFQNSNRLSSIFVVEELAQFRSSLPEASNLKERITTVISYLFPRSTSTGDNALVILCRVLGNRYEEDEQIRHSLLRLSSELSDHLLENQP